MSDETDAVILGPFGVVGTSLSSVLQLSSPSMISNCNVCRNLTIVRLTVVALR